MVQQVDMGVLYTHNGHAMLFVGEQAQGEVAVDGAHYADYVTDDNSGCTLLYKDNAHIATIGNTEEAYEAYVLQVLQTL
jgi:hypothetical protein